ncbi:MAG: gliding motility lipoprotein GldD [Flavobacteriales bacterium]|nr:gliding motility lipoprotein GldD [Flavobacteriales bacterium]
MKHLLYLIIACSLFACSSEPVPKPVGYFRIDLPKKQYQIIDSIPFPFRFELPQYGAVNLKRTAEDERFLNIDFAKYGARIHLSYLKIDSNLPNLLEDSRTLVYKHIEKAQDISENRVHNSKKRVFGIYYSLDGNTASGSQFYLTDSTSHFLRGALYFSVAPNFDSIAPVQAFIKKDIEQFIGSFEWTK